MSRTTFHFSAGGLVTRDGKVLLIQPAGRSDVWTFPKGLIERGEEPSATAVREVEEETGYRCRILRELSPTSYWYRQQGHLVKKKVYWFAMKPLERVGEPDAEVGRAAWFPFGDALERLSYPEDRELLRALISQDGA